jgi:hypothetical protein
MTAEVAIMNKLGVALAADSTVTIGDKTYDTTNKLFTLSKFHPVGMLVYNAMELTTVPLEIIVKNYRSYLDAKEKPALSGYSDSFVQYLRRLPIRKAEETESMDSIAVAWCRTINASVSRECRKRSISPTSPSSPEVKSVLSDILDQFEDESKQVGAYKPLRRVTEQSLLRYYPNVIERSVDRDFRRYAISDHRRRTVARLIAKAILSNSLSSELTGFVIAGYGSDEYYPSLIAHETDGFVAGQLKILSRPERKIGLRNKSYIYPIAQRDVADLVIQGVDPAYQQYIDEGISDLLSGIAPRAWTFFGVNGKARIARFKALLEKSASTFVRDMKEERDKRFVSPLLDAVMFLDKSELAMLAENLVSITALKQKIALEIATVGGAVDVAVISKNDGFIWIKRKYYFDEKLNRFFVQKYLNPRNQRPQRGVLV